MNREEWNERYQAVPILWDVDPGRFLGGEIRGATPGVALDLGAGEGRNAIWLAQHGWHVTAVDFRTWPWRGAANERDMGVTTSITWVSKTLRSSSPLRIRIPPRPEPVPPSRADQRRTVLRRAVDALAPGGTILVVGYDDANATEGKEGVRDPALLFSPEDIVKELDGLQVRARRAATSRRGCRRHRPCAQGRAAEQPEATVRAGTTPTAAR